MKKINAQSSKSLIKPRLFLLLLLSVLLLPFFWNKEKEPIYIPQENLQATTHWSSYNNPRFRFSFKYPDGEISDFQAIKFGTTIQKLTKEVRKKSSASKGLVSEYNVKFGVDAWQTQQNLVEFTEENLLETRTLDREKVIHKKHKGVRISNKQTDSEVYFIYYIFRNNGIIYNFALFSDDPALIDGNIPLLEKIISTANFY